MAVSYPTARSTRASVCCESRSSSITTTRGIVGLKRSARNPSLSQPTGAVGPRLYHFGEIHVGFVAKFWRALSDGHTERDGSSTVSVVLGRDASGMCLDDAPGDREPHPHSGATALCCVERFENLR